MDDRLLKAGEAASFLGISRRRAYLLGRRGILPVVRLGPRQVRYSAAALRELVERGGVSFRRDNSEVNSTRQPANRLPPKSRA